MRTFGEVELGVSGTDVVVAQSMLRALQVLGKDGKAIDIDGECGANTQYAINEFQKRQKAYGCTCGNNGCGVTGVITKSCWNRILGV